MEKVEYTGERKAKAIVGLLILLLAVVGIVFLIVASVQGVSKLLDDDSQLREFDTFLEPIVMQDPLPFSRIEEAEPRFLLQSSIWDALYSDTDGTKFQMDDNGKMIVPVADIEASKAKLFGPNVTLTYESIGEGETTFEYYSDENTYHIPVYGIDAYTPYVVDGEKKGNTMVLTVGYVPAGEYWTQDKDGNKIPPKPSRYMEYTMTKVDEENYILSAIASLDDSASSAES